MSQQLITSKEAEKQELSQVFSQLESSEKGLTSDEAQKRLEKFGPNEIMEKKESPYIKFLKNFWGPIPWMIEIAAILSIIISHYEDFAVIISMLLVNAVVRFWEENKADNAVELLKQKLALQAKVLRDNKWTEMMARDLVPGDVVRVRLGDIVPGDIKLFEGEYLSLDESALTGESLPVDKQISNIAYEGSIVRKGEMNGVVVGTGGNTFFGRTTALVSEAKTTSHFQQAVINIGNYLIIFAVSLVALIIIVGIIRSQVILQLIQFALVLTIAAIPVALPAVLMVSMAVGAVDLAKKKALTKKLLSIEELAGMDILCSDKTGTITKNEITVGEIRTLENFTPEDVILYGVLASRKEDKDPIDDAFFKKFEENKGDISNYKMAKFTPFDPVIKRTEALIEKDGENFKVSKGAIQVILSLVSNKDAISSNINSIGDKFASQGYRALGVAKTDKNGTWHYIGVAALFDPPRDDSAEVIKKAMDLGVDVKMVTGDHAAIAKQMAATLGMGTNIISSSELLEKKGEEAVRLAESANGFAEVYPEHKYHIVESLQSKGHVIGMTGDGVNDAPALKKADVGIAVSNATDAAKSAADIVLTEPGLSIIIGATEESRIIFERMKSYATYRIAETVRVLIFLVLAILIFSVYPISALLIVILALLNDIPIMTIAFDNAKPAPKPVRWRMQRVLIIASTLGLIGVAFSFTVYLIARNVFLLSPQPLQTLVFLKLAVAGHMTIYLTRSEDRNVWNKPYPAWILLLTCESTQFMATIFTVYGILMAPIGWLLAGFVWGFAGIEFIVTNYLKVGVIRWLNRRRDKKIVSV